MRRLACADASSTHTNAKRPPQQLDRRVEWAANVMPGDVAVARVQHAGKPVFVVPISMTALEQRRRSQRPREPIR